VRPHTSGSRRPTLSAVIPAGPGSELALSRCLAGLARCHRRPDEIIVVANGAGAAVEDIARRSGAVVLVESRALGPGPARNLGAGLASSEIVLFLDSDVEPHPDVPDAVARHFADDGGPAAVFGSYDDDPAAPALVSRYRNLLHHWVHQRADREASTFWTGCGAVRREVFEAAGGFSDGPIEDVRFGLGLRRSGHRIRLDPDLQVRHVKRWRMIDLITVDLFERAIPWSELLVRHGTLLNDLNSDRTGRISVGLLAVVLLAVVASFWWPPALAIAAAAAMVLVLVNLAFYRLLARRGGLWFAAASVPLHWLYYLVCGCGLVVGTARAVVRRDSAERVSSERAEAA
jgi:glycosyltransferase involved in cell wall biosynthesis